MTTREVLQAARETISEPKDWCVGYRTNAKGAHCALGALDVVLGSDWPSEVRRSAVDTLSGLFSNDEIPALHRGGPEARVAGYNNSHDHRCVLAWFDTAIEKAS